MSISNSFMTFIKEAPEQQKAWGELVGKLDMPVNLTKRQKHLLI